ncbi:hypothetical protein ROZALSC1DRAFT_30646, partial [Rozella allomycis CSF55]
MQVFEDRVKKISVFLGQRWKKTDIVNPSAEKNHAIILATGNGNIEIAKYLLTESRAVTSPSDNLAIQWASYSGHADIVKMLLEDSRVDPSANDNFSIQWASNKGHADV